MQSLRQLKTITQHGHQCLMFNTLCRLLLHGRNVLVPESLAKRVLGAGFRKGAYKKKKKNQ